MREGGGELVATDESTVITESLLDATVVEDSQSDGCFPDLPWTYEGDWGEIFSETNDLLDQVVASTTGPQRRGRRFTRRARYKREIQDSLVVEISDLV